MQVGEHTYGHEGIQVRGVMNNITIGKYCSIAVGVIMDGGFHHDPTFVSTYPFFNRMGVGKQNAMCKGDIEIGNDVTVGEGVLIMSGVRIGNGAIIGARSIVTKDVPNYGMVAGSPAQMIRWRFDPEHMRQLSFLKWWDWPHEKVLEELPNATDIQEFINKHKV